MMQVKSLSLIFIICNISDSLLRCCSCWSFGQNFSALTFNVLSSLLLLVVGFESQCNSMRYSSWFLPVGILINLIVLSLLMKIFSIIPIFHFPQFFSSPFIITTSLILVFTGFSLWLTLFLSLRAAKYSWTHLFQAALLHLCTYLCRFFSYHQLLPLLENHLVAWYLFQES